MPRLLTCALLCACYPADPDYVTGAGDDEDAPRAEPVAVRVATFNVALHGTQEGGILRKLERASNEHGQGIAAILQGIVGRVRDGTATNPNAPAMAAQVRPIAETAWRIAEHGLH